MVKIMRTVMTVLVAVVWAATSWADDSSQQEMRSLDEQVQAIKSDVLGIASELSLLEEQLLYPSNTQLAVFVALAEEESFRLDAVRVQIDGRPVAHYIYSHKELDALQSGGVQRIYTGNVTTGQHQLEISVVGKLPNGNDFSRSEDFAFTKDIEPRLIRIVLANPGSGGSSILVDD